MSILILLIAAGCILTISGTVEEIDAVNTTGFGTSASALDIMGYLPVILLLGILGPAIAVLYNGYRESERRQINELRRQRDATYITEQRKRREEIQQAIRAKNIQRKKQEAERRRKLLTQTLECKNKHEDNIIREFIPGDGLFDVAVTKFDVPSYAEQVESIKELKEVITFNPTTKVATLNLDSYGMYEVVIDRKPKAERTDPGHYAIDNPFISPCSHTLCLGITDEFYDETFRKGNYHECLRIIIKILSSDDDSDGFRKWSECK
jgi:hypothetical protein